MQSIIIDQSKCDGCRVCEEVCSLLNEGRFDPEKSRIKVIRTIDDEIVRATPVISQKCHQCAAIGEPQCVKYCYTGALQLNSSI
jgi:anaerobic carbon-monoxide dehydrogenase iron sulfur subunit